MFKSHIRRVVSTAKQRIFLLFRTFLTKDRLALLKGYKSYVLPLLDYCSPVWSPSTVEDTELIESVQRLFTRKIHGMLNVPYPDRLSILGIKTLEARRLTNDLVLCFKIIHGFIKGSPENFGLKLSQRQSRGHNFKLEILHSLVNVRKHFFGSRVCVPWNNLPSEAVNAPSVELFKKILTTINVDQLLG